MKILEMINLIEKHEMVLWRKENKIHIRKEITDSNLLEKCRMNRQYFLMLLKIRTKFDYLKKVLENYSKKITDKQILYYVFMCEQDVYVQGTEMSFSTTSKEEMQELIRMMEQSCDRVAFK